MRVTIVGGGILGTAHALEAIGRGHEVVQLEREAEARGATVRNFGLIWVSGRATDELAAALRARELWEKLGAEIRGVGFRPTGSLTLLRTERELAVADEVVARADADCRGFSLLETGQVRALNPALRGEYLAGLHCSFDAAVESRQALPAMREYMAATGRYAFLPRTEARAVDGQTVIDDRGHRHDGDLVLVRRRGSRRPRSRARRRPASAPREVADDADRIAGRTVDHRYRGRGQLPLLPRLRRTGVA